MFVSCCIKDIRIFKKVVLAVSSIKIHSTYWKKYRHSLSYWFWVHISFAHKKIIALFLSRRKQLCNSKKMLLSPPSSSSFVQLVPEKKKRNINLCIFARVIKMCKVAPNCLAHLKVEIILFWHHGHYKMVFYLVWQMLICSTSNTTSKVVLLNTRGQGKDTLKHQLPINEKLLLKVLHLVHK